MSQKNQVRTVRFHQPGEPDGLTIDDLVFTPLGDGDVRIAVKVLGGA